MSYYISLCRWTKGTRRRGAATRSPSPQSIQWGWSHWTSTPSFCFLLACLLILFYYQYVSYNLISFIQQHKTYYLLDLHAVRGLRGLCLRLRLHHGGRHPARAPADLGPAAAEHGLIIIIIIIIITIIIIVLLSLL